MSDNSLSWRCFHCDEVFNDSHAACMHFGYTEDSIPACKIKAGAEGSILEALRRAEADAERATSSMHNESSEGWRAYHDLAARVREQVTASEELGYERGLYDALASHTSALAERDAEIAMLREALKTIAATNQIREFMGDDKSDGYGEQGWVARDGQYAKIARAALATERKPAEISRPWVDDEMAILRRLAEGDTIVFSQDGDMAWFTKGDRAFVGDAIMSLRSKGYLLRKCDDEENYRGLSEYDMISDAGRAALAKEQADV